MKGLFQTHKFTDCSVFEKMRERGVRTGFTLMELLVVIAIIAVLTSVGAVFLRDPKAALQVPAGVALATSVFQSAKNLAQTKNTAVMVLVHNDKIEPQSYLRTFLTVYNSTPGASTEVWNYDTKPVQLPRGVYFDEKRSKMVLDDATSTKQAGKEVLLPYPGHDLTAGAGIHWIAYRFAPNGVLDYDDPAQTAKEAGFVLVAGRMNEGTATLTAQNYDAGGFIVHALGGLSVFRESSQIDAWAGP